MSICLLAWCARLFLSGSLIVSPAVAQPDDPCAHPPTILFGQQTLSQTGLFWVRSLLNRQTEARVDLMIEQVKTEVVEPVLPKPAEVGLSTYVERLGRSLMRDERIQAHAQKETRSWVSPTKQVYGFILELRPYIIVKIESRVSGPARSFTSEIRLRRKSRKNNRIHIYEWHMSNDLRKTLRLINFLLEDPHRSVRRLQKRLDQSS